MAGQRRRKRLIVETLCPEGIPDAEYRRLLFERPGFASKISVIGARDDGVSTSTCISATARRRRGGSAARAAADRAEPASSRTARSNGMRRGRELGFGFSLRDPGGRPVGAAIPQAGGARAGPVASHRGDLQEPHLQEMPGRQPGIPAQDAVASGTGTDRPFLLSRDGRPGAPGRWRPQRGDGETARRSARWHQRSTRQVDSIIRSSTNRNGKPVATEAACRE